MKIDWKLIWDSIKEPLREIVLYAIPISLAYLEKIPDYWALIICILLRAVDKYLHKSDILEKGITGF